MIKKNNINTLISLGKIALLFTVFFSFSSCSSDKKENDWSKEKLKGKVKSLTEISYVAIENNGKIEKGQRVNEAMSDFQNKYGEHGFIIERNEYKSDGSLIGNYIYKYGDNDKIVEGSEIRYYNGSLMSKNISKYKDGNRIEGSIYNADGNLDSKYTSKYDKDGNRIEISFYDADDSLVSRGKYKFDKDGNGIESKMFNPDGSLHSKVTFKYDENGNEIEANYTSNDGSFDYQYISQYDKSGNKLERKIYDPKGNLKYRYTYKYDEHGNVTERSEFKADGTLNGKFTTKYEYDKVGNWIKVTKHRTEYEKEIAVSITERTFEYYK